MVRQLKILFQRSTKTAHFIQCMDFIINDNHVVLQDNVLTNNLTQRVSVVGSFHLE